MVASRCFGLLLFLTFRFFFFNDTATTEIYTLSLHDALPISLEHRVRLQRNRRAVRRVGVDADVMQPEPRQPADPRIAGGECDRVPDQHPLHADDAERDDAHHHRIECVLGAHQAPIEECQADGHQQDERTRHEHPCSIPGGNSHTAPPIPAALIAARWTASALTAVRAALSTSPVRMRTTRSIGWMKILPSPTSPVRAADRIACTHGSTNGSEQTISIFTFSWNSMTSAVPRYCSKRSCSPPCPLTRLSVMPVTPARNSAALTSDTRSGRTIVVMSFMRGSPWIRGEGRGK